MSDTFPFLSLPPEIRNLVYDILVPVGSYAEFVPSQGWDCREGAAAGQPTRLDIATVVRFASTSRQLRSEVLSHAFGRMVFHIEMDLQEIPGGWMARHHKQRMWLSSNWPVPAPASSVLSRIENLCLSIPRSELVCLWSGILTIPSSLAEFRSIKRLEIVRADVDHDLAVEGSQAFLHSRKLEQSIQTVAGIGSAARGGGGAPILLCESYHYRGSHQDIARARGEPTHTEYLASCNEKLRLDLPDVELWTGTLI